jgi:hypothetical protein
MIVAMVSVGVMQVSVHEIIRVIAVRHGFVSATGTMDMPWSMR